MTNCNDVNIMKEFPDFMGKDFNIHQYNQRFVDSNMMIHAYSKNVAYPEHWGSLSIKCAFNGTEYYQSGLCSYAVTPTNYLIFNNGKYYSSHIFSKEEVESFTINFSPAFEKSAVESYFRSHQANLDNPFSTTAGSFRFVEKLYPEDRIVTPVIRKLRFLSIEFEGNREAIQESFYELLAQMFLNQQEIWHEIRKIKAVKPATKAELYLRLHQARDYVDSCYAETISLEKLSGICCLNTAYFLRQFKSYFGITPRQYLIRRRMEVASKLLQRGDKSVTEVCYESGYADLTSFGKLFKQFYGLSPEKYQVSQSKKSIFT